MTGGQAVVRAAAGSRLGCRLPVAGCRLPTGGCARSSGPMNCGGGLKITSLVFAQPVIEQRPPRWHQRAAARRATSAFMVEAMNRSSRSDPPLLMRPGAQNGWGWLRQMIGRTDRSCLQQGVHGRLPEQAPAQDRRPRRTDARPGQTLAQQDACPKQAPAQGGSRLGVATCCSFTPSSVCVGGRPGPAERAPARPAAGCAWRRGGRYRQSGCRALSLRPPRRRNAHHGAGETQRGEEPAGHPCVAQRQPD